jgi:membrane protein DedA with SNARE-associated domain
VLTAVAAMLGSSPPPELPGFLNLVAPYLEHYSYWAVLLLVTLEDFGIPVPGETILIAAAIFAGAGRLNVVIVGVVGFIAAVMGDNIGFAIGHFGGRALALRWGKYVFLTEERLAKAEVFFNRHGGKIIVVARFIEGLRQANGIIAGISGMRWLRFLAFNALGAALWVGTWVSVGYFAGQHITTIYHYITLYSYYVLIAFVVLLLAYIVWRLRRRRKNVAAKASGTPAIHSANEGGAEVTHTRPADSVNSPGSAQVSDAPAADTPAADAPAADVLAADAPAADTPAANVPAADASSADLPVADAAAADSGQATGSANAVGATAATAQAPGAQGLDAQAPDAQAPDAQAPDAQAPDAQAAAASTADNGQATGSVNAADSAQAAGGHVHDSS